MFIVGAMLNLLKCLALSRALPSKILSPFQIFDFQAQCQSYFTNQQRKVVPACFVLPANAGEVSTALKTLVQNDCQFTIRSGGHSPIRGWSNMHTGVTLDLSELRGVEIAVARVSVEIRPGSRWLIFTRSSQHKISRSLSST